MNLKYNRNYYLFQVICLMAALVWLSCKSPFDTREPEEPKSKQ